MYLLHIFCSLHYIADVSVEALVYGTASAAFFLLMNRVYWVYYQYALATKMLGTVMKLAT